MGRQSVFNCYQLRRWATQKDSHHQSHFLYGAISNFLRQGLSYQFLMTVKANFCTLDPRGMERREHVRVTNLGSPSQ